MFSWWHLHNSGANEARTNEHIRASANQHRLSRTIASIADGCEHCTITEYRGVWSNVSREWSRGDQTAANRHRPTATDSDISDLASTDGLQRHHLASRARDSTVDDTSRGSRVSRVSGESGRQWCQSAVARSPDGRQHSAESRVRAHCRFAHSTVRVRSVQWWKRKKNGGYLGVVGATCLQHKCEYRLAEGFKRSAVTFVRNLAQPRGAGCQE
ncbi:Uncharacterized protein DBV15_04819 [Temnothorax longispinosus]|uniref:Uncharacterized protein n=1 Tax=Temnothorax longispinosus TaxID=300112 RepID=A0A4S2KL96_9HYME|nr:Uncharacterized protein DBV15_04819 [Temnothorax longispinosus]